MCICIDCAPLTIFFKLSPNVLRLLGDYNAQVNFLPPDLMRGRIVFLINFRMCLITEYIISNFFLPFLPKNDLKKT